MTPLMVRPGVGFCFHTSGQKRANARKSRKALRKHSTNFVSFDEPINLKSIELPAVIALERLQREKQDACASAGTRTKPRKCKVDAPPPPKIRSKKVPLRPAENPRDQAANFTERVDTGLREKRANNTARYAFVFSFRRFWWA
jgi:hypothetical protein